MGLPRPPRDALRVQRPTIERGFPLPLMSNWGPALLVTSEKTCGVLRDGVRKATFSHRATLRANVGFPSPDSRRELESREALWYPPDRLGLQDARGSAGG
jgi:hypothetical protein